MLARADVDMIGSRAPTSPADAASPARVDRYLYPVTRMLAGPNPPDWLARLIDFYMPDWHDPHLQMDTALAGRGRRSRGRTDSPPPCLSGAYLAARARNRLDCASLSS